MNHNNKKLRPFSQNMRKNMTKEERHLWYDFLKELDVTVKRQHVIGSYIVDFYIASAQLAIELDGSQHYEDPEKDRIRDAELLRLGILVKHYSNTDINRRFSSVCEDIHHILGTRKASP